MQPTLRRVAPVLLDPLLDWRTDGLQHVMCPNIGQERTKNNKICISQMIHGGPKTRRELKLERCIGVSAACLSDYCRIIEPPPQLYAMTMSVCLSLCSFVCSSVANAHLSGNGLSSQVNAWHTHGGGGLSCRPSWPHWLVQTVQNDFERCIRTL